MRLPALVNLIVDELDLRNAVATCFAGRFLSTRLRRFPGGFRAFFCGFRRRRFSLYPCRRLCRFRFGALSLSSRRNLYRGCPNR